MKTTSSAKKNILKKIKQALATPVPLPFQEVASGQNLFINDGNDPEVQFAENFSALQGRFSFCSNETELVVQLQTLLSARQWNKIFVNEVQLKELLTKNGREINMESGLASCDASITTCECLIARTGSIVLSSVQSGRTPSVYAP